MTEQPVDVMKLRAATADLPPVVGYALYEVLRKLVESTDALHARLDKMEYELKKRGSL